MFLQLQPCLIPTLQAAKPFLKVILRMCIDCREQGVVLDTSNYKWRGISLCSDENVIN